MLKMGVERSVVLITPGDTAIRESGSGFVIANTPDESFIVTCSHVLRNWNGHVCINGESAQVEKDGGPLGVDLAILRVPKLHAPALLAKSFVKEGKAVYGVSFSHLYGNDYVRSPTKARAGRGLTLQTRSKGVEVPAWEVLPDNGTLVPGNSGSPIFDAGTNRVAGILSHANRDGRAGVAISTLAIGMIWELPVEQTVEEPRSRIRASDIPEILEPIRDRDDLNRDRFGGEAERSGRRLEAHVTEKKPDYFYFDLHVISTDGSVLEPPAVFYLHDTYARWKIIVQNTDANNEITVRDISTYGTYVVGCQVRDRNHRWVSLELDLSKVKAIPRRFVGR